jgi:2-methylcitrate dehydratase PrpD
VTRELAEYAVGISYEDYPQEVIERAKTLILDNIGCMLGGSRSMLGKTMLEPVRNMGGLPEATIVGGGARVPATQAALINGTTANALDYDDGLIGIGHPGASLIPSALALGETVHASGKEILNAALVGYDVGDRIGMAIQPTQERHQKVWGVGTWHTFCAVAAAAKVLALDLQQTLHAYGIAGATAPLPNTQKWGWEPEERPVHWVKEPTGWPAWTGTMAAILAQHGFIGNRYILDGENGFWIMAGSDRCDWNLMTEGLGSRFDVMEHVSIKPYPCCKWHHSPLDCITELKERHDLQPDEIQAVIIYALGWLKRQEVYRPLSIVDAEFSIPYTAAMVLLGKTPGPRWYTQENLDSQLVHSLADRVRVEVDPDLDRGYYERCQMSAGVKIITTRGEFQTYQEVPRGDPGNPLAPEEIERKFRDQALLVLNEAQVSRVQRLVGDLENLDDIHTLMAILAS